MRITLARMAHYRVLAAFGVLVASALLASACTDESRRASVASPTPSVPTIFVALVLPLEPGSTEQRLGVMDLTNGTTKTVASSREGWSAVSWSPDGNYLAALEGNRSSTLHVFEREGWSERTVSLANTVSVGVSWSPDSARFVVIGMPFREYRPDLSEIARYDGPPARAAGPGASGGFSLGAWWSPDNVTVAVELDGRLVVLWPDGAGDIIDLPEGLPAVTPAGWRDTRTLVASGGLPPEPPRAYAVTLAKGRSSWEVLQTPVIRDPDYEAALERLSQLHPNMMMGGGITADGRGVVSQYVPPSDLDPTVHFNAEILFGDDLTSADLGTRGVNGPLLLLLKRDYDVVVVGGEGKMMRYQQLP